jgi:flagellin
MRINTNLSAINTLNQLGRSSSGFAKSVQKLSSGFRINRAADDAAGLGIANRLSADIRSLKQASRNAEQANSLLQVAEGAAQTIQNILERMKELATQSGSDNTDAEGRVQIEAEFTALRAEITRVVETTKFQGKSLLDASFGNSVDTGAGSTALVAGTGLYEANLSGTAAGTYTFTQGAAGEITADDGAGTTQTVTGLADGKQTVNFDVFGLSLELDANFTSGAGGTIDSTDLVVVQGAGGGSFMVSSSGAYTSNDLVSLNSLDLTVATLGIDADTLATAADSQAALANIDGAINVLSSVFGDIGAAQNRIDFSFANVNITVENFMAAESVIRDVDMAAEVTEMTKYQILQQAGTAMLAQANAAPQGVLRLLA